MPDEVSSISIHTCVCCFFPQTLRTSLIRWLAGESREERQARRLGILGATREGIEDIGRRVGEAELCAEVNPRWLSNSRLMAFCLGLHRQWGGS